MCNALIAGADEVKTLALAMLQSDSPDMRDFAPLDGLDSAIDWWREAGVDCDFSDEATDWLAKAEPAEAVTAAPPPIVQPPARPSPLERALAQGDGVRIGGDRGEWPDSLEKFREWWMTEPSLADGSLDRRLPPRGVAGARLMVLVGQPEGDDDEGLLTGGAGRLLSAMLKAMGVADHEVYLSSTLPAPMALPDWADLSQRGLGDVVRHHLELAAPQRVLAIGRSQLELFGFSPDQAREPLTLDCGTRRFPLLAAPDFSQLARSAPRRERFWNRWLEWTR